MSNSFSEFAGIVSRTDIRPLLAGTRFGVEKESLRVDRGGRIAKTPHPEVLGSALTHPSITTDYSEALMEFITEPLMHPEEVIERLQNIQQIVTRELPEGEVLWSNSMPCQLGADHEIPVADYGSSNVGRMKRVYRLGLGHRYSRKMQTIAGVHFNFSIPDSIWQHIASENQSGSSLQTVKTRGYMSLVRNFRRWYWLLIYLMGASPAVCRSFVAGRPHRLVPLGADEHTLHAPFGTSLRMGDLGYQSSAQEDLYVCYNDLESYVATLREALTTSYPEYRKIGEFDAAGERIQLNDHILQIENEFYSSIRPKQPARSGETQLKALESRGIEYIEVRCLDLNPFSAVGIDLDQMLFLETFLISCLIEESAPTSREESEEIRENHRKVVYEGRAPGLILSRGSEPVALQEWGCEIMDKCRSIAELLDQVNGTSRHGEAVDTMSKRLSDPDTTPSAQVLSAIRQSGKTYFGWAMQQSDKFTRNIQGLSLSPDLQHEFETAAAVSREAQLGLEQNDRVDFEEYIADYFAQYAPTVVEQG